MKEVNFKILLNCAVALFMLQNVSNSTAMEKSAAQMAWEQGPEGLDYEAMKANDAIQAKKALAVAKVYDSRESAQNARKSVIDLIRTGGIPALKKVEMPQEKLYMQHQARVDLCLNRLRQFLPLALTDPQEKEWVEVATRLIEDTNSMLQLDGDFFDAVDALLLRVNHILNALQCRHFDDDLWRKSINDRHMVGKLRREFRNTRRELHGNEKILFKNYAEEILDCIEDGEITTVGEASDYIWREAGTDGFVGMRLQEAIFDAVR